MSDQEMRVLFVLDSLNVGGTETHVLSIAREFLRRGIWVTIASSGGKMLSAFQQLGCPIYTIPFVSKSEHSEDAANSITTQLKQLMEIERITIISLHQLPSTRYAVLVAKELRIPYVFTVHGTYYGSNLFDILKESAAVISVSPPLQEWLQQQNQPSILIPNGIDMMEYHPQLSLPVRHRLGIPSSAPVVVYAGRLSWEKADIGKQVLHACGALRKNDFPSLHVLIVGGGQRYTMIKKLADKMQLNQKQKFIHVLGVRRDLRSIYAASDCVVGTGRVALEAMACARTVVGVGSKGYFGIIRPAVYDQAWQFYFGDHQAKQPCSKLLLTNAIRTVLASPEKRLAWGNRGRIYVQTNFNIGTVTNRLLQIYASI